MNLLERQKDKIYCKRYYQHNFEAKQKFVGLAVKLIFFYRYVLQEYRLKQAKQSMKKEDYYLCDLPI